MKLKLLTLILLAIVIHSNAQICTKAYKIVIIGSSTAYGAGASPLDSSWARKFTAYLKKINPNYQVNNLAVSGSNTYWAQPSDYIPPANRPLPNTAGNITTAVNQHPDAILINFPSNDVVNGLTIQEQEDNFKRITHVADSAGIPFWISTLQPRNNYNSKQVLIADSMFKWINEYYKDKAMDFKTGLTSDKDSILFEYNSGDGIHLNNAGHAILFQRVVAMHIPDSLCARSEQCNGAINVIGGGDFCTNTNVNLSISAPLFTVVRWESSTDSFVNNTALIPSTYDNITVVTGTNVFYRAVVQSSICGAKTTNISKVTSSPPVTITTQPANTVISNGNPAMFNVVATGKDLSYQWQEDVGNGFENISVNSIYTGVNTATLSVSSTQGDINNNQYRCILTDACNTSITSQATTVTIRNKHPEFKIAGGSFSYNGLQHLATAYAYGNNNELDTLQPAVLIKYTGITAGNTPFISVSNGPVAAGTYKARAYFSGNDTYVADSSEEVDISITPAPLTIKANDHTKLYGEQDPSFAFTISDGSLATNDAISGAPTRSSGNNTGVYTITIGSLNAGSNYTVTFIPGSLTINAAPISITADAKSKVYGANDPALTYKLTKGSLVAGDVITGSLTRAAGENVGTYAITQGSLMLSNNYLLSFTSSILTITPKGIAITVTADNKSKTYGNAEPVLTYRYTSGVLQTGDSFSGSLQRDPGEDVGTYKINQGTLSLGANYTINFVPGVFTITKRTLTVTANNISKTYGNTDPALTYRISNGSLASWDSFTGAPARTPGENIGSYTIVQGSLAVNTNNYTYSFVNATFSISQRLIGIKADAKSKIYGSSDPAFTYTISSGSLAFSDVISGALSRATGQDVGTYTIQQGSIGINNNYKITYYSALLTINKMSVAVKADGKSKVYGDADPMLTYQITSGTLFNGDTFSGSITRAPGEAAANYSISIGTLSLPSNYKIVFTNASFAITKRSVTIKADAKTKLYGTQDPPLTYTLSSGSLAFNDQITGSLVRNAGENPGSYTINKGTIAINVNYNISYISAVLTITKTVALASSTHDALFPQSSNGLSISAMPNPSTSYFNLHINSTTDKQIEVMITNASGNVVEHFKTQPNTTIGVGHQYFNGTYFITVIQGANRVTAELIKGL